MSSMIKVETKEISHETPKAWGIYEEGTYGIPSTMTWFPKSLCTVEIIDSVTFVTMPIWVAKKSGYYIALKYGKATLVD